VDLFEGAEEEEEEPAFAAAGGGFDARLTCDASARGTAAAAAVKVPTRYRRVPEPADECGRMPEPDSCV
jgi:hypothetical protein